MYMKLIASVVIAALLMTGGAAAAAQVTEYGVQPMEETKLTFEKTQVSTEAPAQPKAEKLTAEEAQKLALAHTGLTVEEVTGLRSEYDVERGIPEWDIDFRCGDWEYDYEVHAETGEILKREKEYDPVKKAVKEEKPAEEKPTQTQPAEETLTAEEAKSIALKHAGLTADQVKGLRAEYDVDDTVPEWEVEFYCDGVEYDYEIHVISGNILSWDKDRDD